MERKKNHIINCADRKEKDEPYSIKVARSAEEIESLREIWEKWQCHPNADIDFYLTIINSREEIIRPHVMVIGKNGKPETMVIGRIERKREEIKIGYKTLFKPWVRILRIIYGGILGEQSKRRSEVIIEELLKILMQGQIDCITLDSLRKNSNIYVAAKKKPGLPMRDRIQIDRTHWKMTLPGTMDEIFQKLSRNRREELRRYPRMIEKDHPGSVEFKCFRMTEDVDQACRDVEKVAEKTYQRGLRVGFINNKENQTRLYLEAEKGWLRAYILYVENKPCAFWIGSLYKRSFHVNFLGFDPDFKRYKPGTIVLSRMLEDLLKDRVCEIDFGFGDALYKQRLGDESWEEASVYIFGPSLKSISINAIRTIILSGYRIAEKVTRDVNLEGKIKKYWRGKLAKK